MSYTYGMLAVAHVEALRLSSKNRSIAGQALSEHFFERLPSYVCLLKDFLDVQEGYLRGPLNHWDFLGRPVLRFHAMIVHMTLGLQIPSKKVLWGVFRGLNTFLEGIWSPRVSKLGP